jgi:tetratricopeptide (TPR) repeat protein
MEIRFALSPEEREWARTQAAVYDDLPESEGPPGPQRVVLLGGAHEWPVAWSLAQAMVVGGHWVTLIVPKAPDPVPQNWARLTTIQTGDSIDPWDVVPPHDVLIATSPDQSVSLFLRGLHHIFVAGPHMPSEGADDWLTACALWAATDPDRASARDLSGRHVRLIDLAAASGDSIQVFVNRVQAELGRFLSGDRLPHPHRQPTVSVCMIVKNEAHNLPRALASVCGIASEIIVVDTGSVDETVQIARRFGARVVERPWTGHFAEARNASLEPATSDWILFIDADEELTPAWRHGLPRLLSTTGALILNTYLVDVIHKHRFPVTRLWRNGQGYRFIGRIHEQLDTPADAPTQIVPLEINHYGYTPSEDVRKDRSSRNLELLLQAHAENPAQPSYWYYLGSTHAALGNYEEAERWYLKVIQDAPGHPVAGSAYSPLGDIMIQQERIAEAWALADRGSRTTFGQTQCVHLLARCANEDGDWVALRTIAARMDGLEETVFGAMWNHKIMARTHRAKSLWLEGKEEEALALWWDLVRENPNQAARVEDWAMHHFRARGLRATLEAADGIPDQTFLPVAVGLAMRDQDHALASRLMLQVLDAGPEPHLYLAYGCLRYGDRTMAIDLFRALDRGVSHHLACAGLYLDDAQVIAEGIEGRKRPLEVVTASIQTGDPIPHAYKPFLLAHLKEWVYAGAWELAGKAALSHPDGAGAATARVALLAHEAGVYRRATEMALSIPEQPDAREALGLEAFRLGDWESAATLLVARATAGPARVRVYEKGAYALRQLGQHRAAMALLAEGQRVRPLSSLSLSRGA